MPDRFPSSFVKSGEQFRDDFGLDRIDLGKWQTGPGMAAGVFSQVGTGMAAAVTGSELVITTGTTSGDELVLRSAPWWKGDAIRLDFQARLSQRIANQEFRVRLATADGLSYIEWMFDGTTATTHKMQSNQGGAAAPHTANAVSVPTLASNPPVYSFTIDLRRGTATWGYRLLNAYAQTGYTYAQRDRLFPLPDEDLFLEIRAKNTGTAGSSTTFAIDVVNVERHAAVGVHLESGSGGIESSRSVPVTLAASNLLAAAVNLPVLPVAAATNGGTVARIAAAASTNATSVKASAGRLHSIWVANNTASAKFLKVFNKASAPTVGTDTPLFTVPIPANSTAELDFGSIGAQLSTGIAYAITGAVADNDTTNVALNDVHGVITYS